MKETSVIEYPTEEELPQFDPELLVEEEMDDLKACGLLMLALMKETVSTGVTCEETEVIAANLICKNIETICGRIETKLRRAS